MEKQHPKTKQPSKQTKRPAKIVIARLESEQEEPSRKLPQAVSETKLAKTSSKRARDYDGENEATDALTAPRKKAKGIKGALFQSKREVEEPAPLAPQSQAMIQIRHPHKPRRINTTKSTGKYGAIKPSVGAHQESEDDPIDFLS